MMSGLRSQRDRMMTCVSLRSGVASSGKCIIDQAPQIQAAATNAKSKNLLRPEKPIIRLIILAPCSAVGCGLYLVIQVFRRIGFELVATLVRAERDRLSVVRLGVTAGGRFITIENHAANRIVPPLSPAARAGLLHGRGNVRFRASLLLIHDLHIGGLHP